MTVPSPTPTALRLPVLETERLWLRAPVIEDFEPFAAFMGSERAKYIGGPYEERRTQERIFNSVAGQWLLRGYGSFIFVEKASGTPVGHGGPWHPMVWPEPELGWCIWSAEHEGTGLAHEAIAETRRHAFEDLGWTTAVSYIDAQNARSQALARRLGAEIDPEAELPMGEPCLVFRHPAPGAQQKGTA